MRILENCTSAWLMPEMQTQIDALREAFSADTSSAFELKRSFPFGSPSSSGLQPSPPLEPGHPPPMLTPHESHGQVQQSSYHAQPITPPISAGFEMPKETSFPPASMATMTNDQHQNISALPPSIGSSQIDWNPTPIFKYVCTFCKPFSILIILLVSGIQLLEQRLPPCHRFLAQFHNNLRHYILLHPWLHKPLLLFKTACTSNSNPTHSHQRCLLLLDTKPHHIYQHIQHIYRPRLRLSLQVCGVIQLQALMTLEY